MMLLTLLSSENMWKFLLFCFGHETIHRAIRCQQHALTNSDNVGFCI